MSNGPTEAEAKIRALWATLRVLADQVERHGGPRVEFLDLAMVPRRDLAHSVKS